MKTVCPFCGAYRYDSQQMSGISTHTHTKYIIPKTGAECNSPAPKKRKKHPDLPECFSHRPAAMPQQVGQAHRSAPHKILCKSPALPDFYTSVRAVPQGTFSCPFRAIHLVRTRGGIVSGFSGTGNVSRGDSVPLGYKQEKIAAEAAIFFLAFYLVARRRALASMRSRVTSSSTAPMITRPRTRF